MASPARGKNNPVVISALRARANFGKLLQQIDSEGQSLVIEKRGRPRAVLLSIRDYVRLAAPEPEILRAIGEEARRNGTGSLSAGQINRIIKSARTDRRNRR